ncbi:hypothetical protein DFH27DRAFT_135640 [Peziza echinospora]|nr:hypothetical protein DFH27DRAFT_135640 [Peziza echinospora]
MDHQSKHPTLSRDRRRDKRFKPIRSQSRRSFVINWPPLGCKPPTGTAERPPCGRNDGREALLVGPFYSSASNSRWIQTAPRLGGHDRPFEGSCFRLSKIAASVEDDCNCTVLMAIIKSFILSIACRFRGRGDRNLVRCRCRQRMANSIRHCVFHPELLCFHLALVPGYVEEGAVLVGHGVHRLGLHTKLAMHARRDGREVISS